MNSGFPRRAESRTMIAEGLQWEVTELVRGPNDGASSLIFDAESIIRRVRHYPADWRLLSDEALATLSRQT